MTPNPNPHLHDNRTEQLLRYILIVVQVDSIIKKSQRPRGPAFVVPVALSLSGPGLYEVINCFYCFCRPYKGKGLRLRV